MVHFDNDPISGGTGGCCRRCALLGMVGTSVGEMGK